MGFFRYPFFILFGALMVACLVMADDSSETLLHVQILHRHGARSPVVSYNKTAICGTEFPCGYLNTAGKKMMQSIGSFFWQRYGVRKSLDLDAFLPSNASDPSVSYSRSTDVDRTLQSANAMLSKLFPNRAAFLPIIHTVDLKTDTLLDSAAHPALRSVYMLGMPEIRKVCNPVVDKSFTPFEKLAEIAAEVDSSEFCSRFDHRVDCALTLCDIGKAYQSNGKLVLAKYALLRVNLDDLCAVTTCSYRYNFDFNSSNPLHVKQGSGGQILAQQLLSNMRDHIANKTTFKIMHYSTHDTTLVPLAVTLGNNSDTAMLPPFAATYVFELLDKDGVYYVRVLYGHTNLKTDSSYKFSFSKFTFHCMNSAKDVYEAEKNMCPLDDFERFIDSTKSQDKYGMCIVDPVLMARMQCPVNAAASGGTPLSSECLWYRQQCPSLACEEGYWLNATDYGCYIVSSSQTSHEKDVLKLIYGCVIALGVLLAIIIIVLAFWLSKVVAQNKKYKEKARSESKEAY